MKITKDLNYKVGVIIANYNGEKFLENCLNSIVKTNYKKFKTIIVDDGSTDTSLKIIEKFKNKLQIILLQQEHKGAAAARNLAISTYKNNYDVLIFLDNDTEVTPNWITHLIDSLYEDSNIGAAQSLLIDYEKRHLIQSAGIYLIPHVCWGISLYQNTELVEKVINNSNICAISACLAVKTSVFNKVPGFDSLLAVSTEDLDFTWRIWIAGFKIVLAKNSQVYHYTKTLDMRKDMKVTLENQYFHISKNSIRTLLKNYSLSYLIYYFPLCIFINLTRAILVLIVRKDISAIKGFFKALWWNFKYLEDTLATRHLIQINRINSDKFIYKNIMLKNNFYEIYKKHFAQTKLLGH